MAVRVYSWLALGLGAYLAFTVASMPAATVYRYFAPAELRLMGLQGTLWSGGAGLGSANGFSLHDIRWSIDALPLLVGRVSGRIQARLSDGFIDTQVDASPSRVEFRALNASTSLPALANVLPIEGTQGLVSLALDELRLQDGWPTAVVGGGRVAQLAVPPLLPGAGVGLIPLGNYEIEFKDTGGDGIAAEIRDAGGPLQVAGQLTLDAEGNYTLEGFAAARSEAPEALVQGLELMTADPDAQGRRRFSLTGSL